MRRRVHPAELVTVAVALALTLAGVRTAIEPAVVPPSPLEVVADADDDPQEVAPDGASRPSARTDASVLGDRHTAGPPATPTSSVSVGTPEP